MVLLRLSTADLAAVRFAGDPVREVVSGLQVLARPGHHLLHRPLQDRAAGLADLDLLVDLVAGGPTVPRFLSRGPDDQPRTVPDALAAVAGTDVVTAQRDLNVLRRSQPGHPRWRSTSATELVERTGPALLRFWRLVLAPVWDRVREITTADLAYRGRMLASEGLGPTLAGVHGGVALTAAGLVAPLPELLGARRPPGPGIWCVPSVFLWPRLGLDLDGPVPVLAYPARGAGCVWERDRSAARPAGRLADLLGRSRVAILLALDTPTTTTRLARELGLAASTVSAHLTAMVRGGLLAATRHGREVFYERTALGTSLTSVDLAS